MPPVCVSQFCKSTPEGKQEKNVVERVQPSETGGRPPAADPPSPEGDIYLLRDNCINDADPKRAEENLRQFVAYLKALKLGGNLPENWAGILDACETYIQRKKEHAKNMESTFQNVRGLIAHGGGPQSCLFVTVTHPGRSFWDDGDRKHCAKQLHKFQTNVLRRYHPDCEWMAVAEPQKNGTLHHHYIIAFPGFDMRGEYDFAANRGYKEEFRKNGKSPLYFRLMREAKQSQTAEFQRFVQFVSAHLRTMKAKGREAPFGFWEAEPLKSDGPDGAARYLSGYLGKGARHAAIMDGKKLKGRMVRYSRGSSGRWRICSARWSWSGFKFEPKGPKPVRTTSTGIQYRYEQPFWRRIMGDIGRVFGVDSDDCRECLGPRWAWLIREEFTYVRGLNFKTGEEFIDWGRTTESILRKIREKFPELAPGGLEHSGSTLQPGTQRKWYENDWGFDWDDWIQAAAKLGA